jgi:hypothetical protein
MAKQNPILDDEEVTQKAVRLTETPEQKAIRLAKEKEEELLFQKMQFQQEYEALERLKAQKSGYEFPRYGGPAEAIESIPAKEGKIASLLADKKITPEQAEIERKNLKQKADEIKLKVRRDLTPQELQVEQDIAKERAVEQTKKTLGITDPDLTAKTFKPASVSLDELGPAGKIISDKFRKAGIDLEKTTLEEAVQKLKEVRTQQTPKATEMSSIKDPQHPAFGRDLPDNIEKAKDVTPDVKRYLLQKKIKEIPGKVKSAVESGGKTVLKNLPKVGAALGAANVASDIAKGDVTGAGLSLAELGLGAAGGFAGGVAPFLDLLRPTEMEPEEDVTSDIPMRPERFRKLKKLYSKE